jgi:hypothetical protein
MDTKLILINPREHVSIQGQVPPRASKRLYKNP